MKQLFVKTIALVVTMAMLVSFIPAGGEGFEIYLNDKAVIQQYGKSLNDVKSLRLDEYLPNDRLTIKYHHCGQTGKNRVITVKNEQNNVLKEWRFGNPTASILSPSAMTCRVKDILQLNNGNAGTLKLFYSSSELISGRLLVNIVVEGKTVANKK